MIDPMMRFLRGVYVETGSVKRQQSTHKKLTFKQIYNLKKKSLKIFWGVVYSFIVAMRTSSNWLISSYQLACPVIGTPLKSFVTLQSSAHRP